MEIDKGLTGYRIETNDPKSEKDARSGAEKMVTER